MDWSTTLEESIRGCLPDADNSSIFPASSDGTSRMTSLSHIGQKGTSTNVSTIIHDKVAADFANCTSVVIKSTGQRFLRLLIG